jgi:ribosomal protein S18 acetylase RimI-like enzyme
VADRLVATAMTGFDGHRGWVYYLAVDPKLRGQGHGRTMMHAAEDWLASRDAPKLNLMVRMDNAAVRAFYVALGYAESDVTVMQRVLPR